VKVRHTVAAGFIAMALAGGLAACGDDDDDSGSGSAASTAASDTAAAPKLSGEPLKVGMVCACTGPVAGTFGGMPELVKAWEEWTNTHGGINGHPVKVVIRDDKNDPATSAKVVRQLVEEDKVQAIVSASFHEAQWAKYIKEHPIAFSGGNAANPEFASEPLMFPSSSNFPVLYYGMNDILKKAGKTKVAVMVCAELPVCAGVAKIFDAVGQKVVGGVKVVNTGKIGATAPNYTSQCLAAKDSGADAALYAHSSDVTARVAAACAQQGFKPQLINYASTMAANWLKTPAYNGDLTAQPNVPLTDTTTPGGKAFHEALDKYAPKMKASSQFGVITMNQWAGLELFKAAAEAGKLDAASTQQQTIDSMYKLKDETLDGLAPPLNFTKGKPAFIPCYFTMGIENGEYTAPDGATPICMPEDKIPALGQVLAAAAG